MRVAIHQPNFMPHFPFFQKMARCDLFVLLVHCQFEKGGYQNRQKINGKWWSYPTEKGLVPIKDKKYANGIGLVKHNLRWIEGFKELLDIKTPITFDYDTDLKGSERLIDICKEYEANEYLTNPDAMEKYLDASKFEEAGIKLVPFESKHQKHTFEIINEYGVEGARKLL